MSVFEEEVKRAHSKAKQNGSCSLDEICHRLERPKRYTYRLAVLQALMRLRKRGYADYFRSSPDQWGVMLWIIFPEQRTKEQMEYAGIFDGDE